MLPFARAVSLLAVLALTLPASAEGCCEGWCREALRIGTPDTPAGQYYVVMDQGCQPDCLPGLSVWIYEEANLIEGLQRLDDYADQTCDGAIAPDAVIF